MKHYLFATLLLTSSGAATHPTKAVVAEYTQADDPQAFAQFLRQVTPANRVPIIYFYADWCGPCKRFRAALPSEQVDEALRQAALIKVNVDSCQELAAYYGISAVPTFIKVDTQGKPVATITGEEWGEDVPDEIAPVMVKLANSTTYDLKQ
jgi:thioredoxin 1